MPAIRILLFALALGLTTQWSSAVHAADPIVAEVTDIENNFPDEVIFRAKASATAGEIKAVTVRYVVGSGPVQRYGNFEITPNAQVQGEHTVKTSGRYFIAPGADFTYWLEVEDTAGNKFETPKQVFWYGDTRFQWKNISEGPVTVFYYGNADDVAKSILTAAQDVQVKTGSILGVEARPFRVMLYNNPRDLIGAQREEQSAVRAQEILRVGVAYSGEDLVQVLAAGGSLGAGDTARHEIAHLFVHWAAGVSVPTWLNEGLAVWSQDDPGEEYLRLLRRGITFNELLLVGGLDTFPGLSDENLLAYGQSYSVISFLVDTYGGEKLSQVFEAIRSGEGADAGIKRIYGYTMNELDAAWRVYVGAGTRSYEEVLPTPIPIPAIVPIGAAAAQASGSGSDSSGDSSQASPAALPPLLPIAGGFIALVVVLSAVLALVKRKG